MHVYVWAYLYVLDRTLAMTICRHELFVLKSGSYNCPDSANAVSDREHTHTHARTTQMP